MNDHSWEEHETTMSFCEHCAGQRFDRAQVLRTLRATRRRFRKHGHRVDAVLAAAIEAIRVLELPHIDGPDEAFDDDDVVH